MASGGDRIVWRLVIGLAAFSALSAIGGGIELVVWPHGNEFVPKELIAGTPFPSFTIPGLLLAVVVGGTNLVCTVLAWRRSRWAVDATLLAGGGLTIWIAAELALMRTVHWLHLLYGGLGLSILVLGIALALRSGSARHRWIVVVTLAEALGFLVPMGVGGLTAQAEIEAWPQAGIMAAAGMLEGLAFGFGQALVLGLPIRRARYALQSAVAAGLVWGAVMSMMALAESGPTIVVWLSIVPVVVFGLTAIGTAQWLELRHHAPRAHRWIGWTALAWAVALPMSFLPGPLVDETTPAATMIVLWVCAGLLMAYTMAVLTWQGVRRLSTGTDRHAPGRRGGLSQAVSDRAGIPTSARA